MDRRRLTLRQAVALDVVVAVLVGAFGCWRELRQPTDLDQLIPLPVGPRVAVQIIAALLLLGRRQRPLTVGALIAGLCLLTPVQPPAAIAYSVAAHARDQLRGAGVLVLVAVCWCLGAQVWQLVDPVTGPVIIGFAIVLGLYVRTRRGLYDALVERAERAEREQVWVAERSAAGERSRLASEMHDVLSHRLSLMLLQAGALATTSTDPTVRKSVEELRRNGAAVLAELRDVFGMMSTADTDRAETGSLADAVVRVCGPEAAPPPLAELVDEWRRTGATIDFDESPRHPMTPATARAVYRVAQEALTNAAKHSPGADVSLSVVHGVDDVVVTVVNGPRGDATDELVRTSGTGTGLAGLRQRVELLDGTFVADRDSSGIFRLRVRLPTGGPR